VERALQVFELLARERGPAPALLSLQMEARLGFRVRIVGAARTFEQKTEKTRVFS